MTAWKYSTTLKSSSTDCPALSLAAAAPVASSLDTLLSSSILQLDIRVLADGQQLETASLEGSALAREVRGWFNKPQASTATAAHGLDRLDLTLSFYSTSGRPKAKKPKLSVSSSDSQTHSQSQPPEAASQAQRSHPPELTLTSHLLSPSSLHFTLVPQITTALDRLAKKLAVAFPLCFNPKWQDRLANDLIAQHSIVQSLCNILGLDGRKDDLRKPHDSDVEREAGLLELTLESHITARYPSPASPASLASPPSVLSPPTYTTTSALETALLLIAKNASAPDAWTSAKGGSVEGGEGGVKKGRKSGGSSKRKAKEADAGEDGGAARKKRKISKSYTDVADGLSAFATDSPDPSSSTLAPGSIDKDVEQGMGEFEEFVGAEQERDEGWNLFGNDWASR
ncbi:hypothetical protein Rt10032_c13g5061 [Rhodotorula toruloides]|uniref:Uncharacterized protein n=1 Tax=Rhodotorula toruloides TaxID=5286 RepID=A0A511KNE4_RHOTO|nr:hypothetical protein Rt10032_c13g5061 [Rhodotorula toruloides]